MDVAIKPKSRPARRLQGDYKSVQEENITATDDPSIKRALKRENGEIVGFIEDGIAHKTVKISKHFFKKYRAWCLDVFTWEQIQTSCHSIVLHDAENNVDYFVTCQEFNNHKGELFDFGYGQQYPLPLSCWHKRKKQIAGQLSLFDSEDAAKE